MLKAIASEAIIASSAFCAVFAIGTLVTVLEPHAVHAMLAVNAFIAKFAFVYPVAIYIVLPPQRVCTEVAVFIVMPAGIHVAVLVISFLIHVFAVLVVSAKEGDKSGPVYELFKLFKERTRKIEVSAKLKSTPFITPPTISTKHV